MGNRTPLYDAHLNAGAKMVDFAGWSMPINYGSQLDEHHTVRSTAGMFDVSHMTILDLKGEKTRDFLRYLLANDVDRLTTPGKALYSCMLQEDGGILDDLIVYGMAPAWYRMVVNAATRDKDLAWIRAQGASYNITIEERTDLAMIAVQGPLARDTVHKIIGPQAEALQALKPFYALALDQWFIARTGYTGEDGYEVMLPAIDAVDFWQQLRGAGVQPCGLGARDTLRLEAGMNLYGTDMDTSVTPLDSGLTWTVALEPDDRQFIGRDALVALKQSGLRYRFVGLILEGRGVLRGHQKVYIDGVEAGITTSGTFSPTLKQAIAMARLSVLEGHRCEVEIRGKLLPARIVKPTFVRHGKSCVDS